MKNAYSSISLLNLIILLLLGSAPLNAQQPGERHEFTYTFKNSEIQLTTSEIDQLSDKIFDFNGQNLDSMLFLSEKLLLASEKKAYAKGIANSYANFGIYFFRKGNYTEALKNYLKAQELSQKGKDFNKVASLSNNIGLIYEKLNDFDKSLLYHQYAIDQSNEDQDPVVLANFYLNYANAKNRITGIEDALPFYYKAIQLMQEQNNVGDLALVYLNMGNAFGRHGLIDSVKSYFDKGLILARQDGNFFNLAYALTSQIRYYTFTGNFKEALNYAEESLEAARLSGSNQHKADALFAISNLQESLGNYKAALNAAREHAAMKDSLNISKQNLEIARIEASLLFEKERALLDNKIMIQENLSYRRLYIISILAVLILMLIGAGIAIYRHNAKIKKANQSLIRKNQEIEDLANKLAALNSHQQMILKILGHDLKGPVLSLATVTEMASNNIFSLDELKEMLPTLSNQTKQLSLTLENTLHWALNQMDGEKWAPENLELTQQIQDCLRFLETALNEKLLNVQANLDESIKIYADPNMVMISIRNVLANAIKFSDPGEKIEITCLKDHNFAVFKVFNKGKLIDPVILKKINDGHMITESQKGTGIGLMLTRSYVIKNKGEMRLTNVEGQGVEVSMSFQLAEANNLNFPLENGSVFEQLN
jgi:signal transduction histidine kinase